MDMFADLIAEADARDAMHANEQCLERALLARAHEMYALLKAFDDAYMRDPLSGSLERVWESVEELLIEIREECK